MVLNCKSPSPIQEASVGNGEGKAGLKRKGPPRLPLCRSKTKSDLETIEEASRMHTEGTNSYGNQRGTMETQQFTIQDEMSPGCISENPEKHAESEVKQTTPENQFETKGCYGRNERQEKAELSDTKSDPKKQLMKRDWKRFLSSSLNCIRRRKSQGKMLGMEDVTFRNTQAAKFECDTAMGDTVPPEHQQNTLTNNKQGCRTVKRRAPFSSGISLNITKLLNAPSHRKKAKGLSEQDINFGFVDSHRSDLSLKKRLRRFFKHGPKKPSPFFHEQLEINHEYLDEETIVLSNRHAEDRCQKTPPDIHEGSHSDGDVEVGGPQSETLTVSAEVSVMGEGDRKEMGNSTHLEASANLITTSGQIEKEDPQGLAEASDGEWRMADATESSRHPELVIRNLLVKEIPRKNLAAQGALALRLSTADTREGRDNILEGQDMRLLVDENACELFQETMAYAEKVVEEPIPQSRVTDEDSLQDNLALKNDKFDCLRLCCDDTNRAVENGPKASSEENLHTKDNGYKHGLHVKVLSSQCSDAFLMQTACSLVQAAMKAALDQLTKELKNKSVRIHTEYHKFQDQT